MAWSGYMDARELQTSLRDLGFNVSPDTVQQLLGGVGKTQEGRIDQAEWQTIVARCAHAQPPSAPAAQAPSPRRLGPAPLSTSTDYTGSGAPRPPTSPVGASASGALRGTFVSPTPSDTLLRTGDFSAGRTMGSTGQSFVTAEPGVLAATAGGGGTRSLTVSPVSGLGGPSAAPSPDRYNMASLQGRVGGDMGYLVRPHAFRVPCLTCMPVQEGPLSPSSGRSRTPPH